MNWYLEVLKKYAVFQGRARRSEYWFFILFNIIAMTILGAVDYALGMQILAPIYVLATFLPSLAVAVRRFHDTGRSGWWVLIALVPLIGSIIYLIFMCIEGEAQANAYGPNPKGDTAGPVTA
ncbi:MAG: DUF805 domain-containing protein [Halopseudomonas sp.]|uniref:DUF805 domain-containing protein n=1 Tax=Halopseudomonas sp. TaxID=2901191 RepID=UPI003001C56D